MTMLAGAALARPLAALAQQEGMPVIGFLHSGTEDAFRVYLDKFRDGLSDAGYVEGQNVLIDYRWAEGKYDRLPALAADLVARHVSVIVASGGNPPAQAAKATTGSIPIVFISGGDPVSGGLVSSLSRPNGNVTGVNWIASELVPKRLDYLRQLVGASVAIGALLNPSFEDHNLQVRELRQAAAAIGHDVTIVLASTAHDLDDAFASLGQRGIHALIMGNDPYFLGQRQQIVALAVRYAIPAIYFVREFVDAGGLLSYGASLADANRQAGLYTARVLKGTKPADMPVWRPTKFELVVNLKTARAFGLSVPPALLATADEVIE